MNSHLDLNFILKYAPMYMDAGKFTIKIGIVGVLLSIVIGFICSIIRYYRIPILKTIVNAYIEISRNTPLMIQLFFLYYGLPKIGLRLEAYDCAVIGLSFLGGSYMAESFRSGFEAVGKAQIESGLSIGLNRWQLVRYVIFPQAIAIAIPGIGANTIFILKETSIVSAVALADLMFVAKDLIGLYYKTNEALLMLVISYLIILLPLSLFLTFVERRIRYAGFGN